MDGEAKGGQTKKRAGQGAKKTALVLLSTALLICLLAQTFVSSLTSLPHLVIPTPKLPAPNAYDIYVQAAKSCASVRVGNKNLRLELGANDWYMGRYPQMYSDAEASALVKANTPVLAQVHQGLTHEYMQPPIRSDRSEAPDHNADLNHLGRLLLVEAQVKLSRGDPDGAMQCVLDAVQFGNDILKGGTLAVTWTSYNIRRNALAEAAKIAPILTAADARKSAQRLQTLLAQQTPFAHILQEEDWATQAALLEVLRQFDGPTRYAYVNQDEKQGALQQLQNRARLCLTDRRELLNEYTRYMDQMIVCTQQPFAANPPLPPNPQSPIVDSLVSYLPRSWARHVQMTAMERRFVVDLALHAYQLEYGRYPGRLKELVPTCLSRLPDDPNAVQGTFGYRRDKSGYTIFSTGGQISPRNRM